MNKSVEPEFATRKLISLDKNMSHSQPRQCNLLPSGRGFSISTFGDHSVNWADHSEVASCLEFPPRACNRGADGTEAGWQYQSLILTIRLRKSSSEVDTVSWTPTFSWASCWLNHAELLSHQMYQHVASERNAFPGAQQTAKATYRVCIHYYLKLPQGGHKPEPESLEMRGTAIHVGEGFSE
jgi:hypothetical protein